MIVAKKVKLIPQRLEILHIMNNYDEVINFVMKLKKEFPKVIFIVANGGFYNVYGKDAIIVGYIQSYKVNNIQVNINDKIQEVPKTGFPAKTLNEVIEVLNKKRLSYIIKRVSSTSILECEKKIYNNANYDRLYETGKKYIDIKQNIQKANRIMNAHFKDEGFPEALERILKELEKFKKNEKNDFYNSA